MPTNNAQIPERPSHILLRKENSIFNFGIDINVRFLFHCTFFGSLFFALSFHPSGLEEPNSPSNFPESLKIYRSENRMRKTNIIIGSRPFLTWDQVILCNSVFINPKGGMDDEMVRMTGTKVELRGKVYVCQASRRGTKYAKPLEEGLSHNFCVNSAYVGWPV